MKKTNILVILFLMVFCTAFSAQKKYVFDETQLTKDKFLLISETDMNCSYEIKKRVSKDIKIVGSVDMDEERNIFTVSDRLIINRGEGSGLREGDKFTIVAQGSKISNPFSYRTLGTLFLKEGIAEITTLYERHAIVTVTEACFPIRLNNYLIPYKGEEQVVKRSVDYKLSKLPESQLTGRVVFTGDNLDLQREVSASGHIVAVDLGKGEVSKGDFVLFYKIVKKGLPKIIIGSGIVIKPQNSNSTVKIIDSAFPIELGAYLTVLPEVLISETDDNKLPLIKDSKSITEDITATEETFDFTTLFPLDEYKLKDKIEEKFLQMKKFISLKKEFVIILRGYACSIGGVAYNLELSKKRVEEVKSYIVKNLDIAPDFIETYFYGEKDTPFDNSTEINRRKNRRVDIQVIGK
ncbi:MAG: OmpA family protein [Acidobacteriota bacterium]